MKAVKIGGTVVLALGGLAAWAPAISDLIAGAGCNQAIISAFTAFGCLLGVGVLAMGGLVVVKATGVKELVGSNMEGPDSYLAGGVAAVTLAVGILGIACTSVAGAVMAYAAPAALPNTLSGMLMVHAGTAPSALVAQDVVLTTMGFLGLSAVLLTLAAVLWNSPDRPCCGGEGVVHRRYDSDRRTYTDVRV